ncbi:hypothetical protein [Haloferax denitrificans]|uniref:Uncharacterized protein n=1 Tax=Haloferax denitrificans ATCC 35960 TaxID=662478 RepID=M0IXI2_9EURY|nr:hypothetical protein [Haloferax denitrificans]EMA00185.1 hypothetical protein C438_17035 [Haloferax denitrificans ATCC 35960]
MTRDDVHSTFRTRLARPRDTPTRLALATLVGSDRFWGGLFLVLPFLALAATRVHEAFVPFAAGLPLGLCLWLQWLSHEFVAPEVAVDSAAATLTLSKPYGNGRYSPVDAADIDRVSIVQLSAIALVRLRYRRRGVSKPAATVIPSSGVAELRSRLAAMGFDAPVRRFEPRPAAVTRLVADPAVVRIAATPLAFLGYVGALSHLYGPRAFVTDAVVVPLVVLVIFGGYSAVWRFRLRRERRS